MTPVRLVMIGGFLGAGKTTALVWLARHYISQGRRVAFIANDQAENLVDTALFRTVTAAAEVAGGCFCCRLHDLLAMAERLTRDQQPDVIFAEPVGSCTDLVATVVQPLKRLYREQYQVAPYVVLLDPQRARRILTGDRFGGFSSKVAYIFHKQLEEADAIAVNKSDLLRDSDRNTLHSLIHRQYPEKPIYFVSARTGENMSELARFQEQQGRFGVSVAEVDYDTYAEGEAELGWLNVTAVLRRRQPFVPDQLLSSLMERVQEHLQGLGAEVAHFKGLLHTDRGLNAGHLVQLEGKPELSRCCSEPAQEAQLVLNARVATDPELLWQAVRQAADEVLSQQQITAEWQTAQRFRPARPVPVMRFADGV